jgi:N-acetylmuramoyl-L-alanine amidase|tara:strand:- start:8036 stop:8668 length:633 start_codon:yes stop_codon:yes gene_type:complete
MNNNFHWLLDAGHGGLHPETGEYLTRGKRSPQFPSSSKYNGEYLYEGVRNRQVLKGLKKLLDENNISYSVISEEWKDISLSDRVKKANNISQETPNCIYLSIHHNAYGKGWNNANGISTYHFPKSNKGFRLAGIFQNNIVGEMDWRDRGVKSSNFYVLKYTKMPSVLTENGFMTNIKEAEVLMSDEGSYRISLAHFEAIKEVNERGLKFL